MFRLFTFCRIRGVSVGDAARARQTKRLVGEELVAERVEGSDNGDTVGVM